MKKFNPEKELDNLKKSKKQAFNRSILSNMYVPLLIIGCSCLALLGATFSLKLTDEAKSEFLVNVEIINGKDSSYKRYVKEGAFATTITSDNSFGSIECSTGNLNYDPLTNTLSSPYINQNTNCVLAFMDDQVKSLEYENLSKTSDELGESYYYKLDADNNYVRLNNMLFRIVRINGDGTYRLMLDDNILSSIYGNNSSYVGSSLESTLNTWYMHNFANSSYVVENPYDIFEVLEIGDNFINFSGYSNRYVGTLSVNEMALISEDVSKELNVGIGMYLMNTNGDDKAYAYQDGKITLVPLNTQLVVRPVINIKGNLVGSGKVNDPYILEED